MKKLIFLLSVLCLVGYSRNEKPKEDDTIKIGVMAALTGDLSFYGNSFQEALVIAQENVKTKKSPLKYEIILEDCSYEPAKSAIVAQKLINIDHVDAVISTFEMFGRTFSPLADKYKIPHITLAVNPDVAKGKYNFLAYTTAQEQARKFVEVLKKKGIKTIALFVQEDPYTYSQAKALREYLKNSEIKIVSDESCRATEKDFRSSIIKAKSAKPDTYVVLVFSPLLDLLYKQMQDQGIHEITGMETFDNAEKPKKFDGMWYVGVENPTSDFIYRFDKAKKTYPPIGSTQTHDAFLLFIQAAESFYAKHNRKPNSEELASELAKIKTFKGESGQLTQDKEGVFHSKAIEKEMKNGEPVEIQ
jgi:branched-chain amino acid transport system substrate-binding protein